MSSQMVLKQCKFVKKGVISFRSMSSQMVLKPFCSSVTSSVSFRSMSSQMVLRIIVFKLINFYK